MWLPQFVSIALTAALMLSTTASAEREAEMLLPISTNNTSRRLSSMAKPLVVTITHGSDFVGGDVGSVSGTGWEKCGRECKNLGNCDSFTWTDENGGTCWLKNMVHAMIGKGGVVSGRVSNFYGGDTPPEGSQTVYSGDLPGNDERSVSETTSSCLTMCIEDQKCNAYSFADGICYFKSAASSLVPAQGFTSAVVFKYFETLG